MWWLWMASTLAYAECDTVSFRDIVAVPAPAILVLGERHGHVRDLRRAEKIAVRLRRTGAPVTLALESVWSREQPLLERYAAGQVDTWDLKELLDWDTSWDFPWSAYEALVTAALDDIRVVAAGEPYGAAPDGTSAPIPPGYADLLRLGMEDDPVSLSFEPRLVSAMAWRDHAIASHAMSGWDGSGYLVVVAGRDRVEGGKGITWQLNRMTDTPVHGFLLADAESLCFPGDRIWR